MSSLSVALSNYNHARYVGGALDAILGQSFSPLEVLVVDDASTDNSMEVLERIARADSRVRLRRNETNQGPLECANRSLRDSVGDYIYFASADDLILPGFFEKSMTMLALHPEAGICSSDTSRIGDRTDQPCNLKTRRPYIAAYSTPDQVMRNFARLGWYIWGHSVILKRSAALDAGGHRHEVGSLADALMNHVAAFDGGACYVPETLSSHRVVKKRYSDVLYARCDNALAIHSNYLHLLASNAYRGNAPAQYRDFCKRQFAEMLRGYLKTQIYEHQDALLEDICSVKRGRRSFADDLMMSLLRLLMKAERALSFLYCGRDFEKELEESSRELRAFANPYGHNQTLAAESCQAP